MVEQARPRRSLWTRWRAWRKRPKPDWQWSTLAIWVGVLLITASVSLPWATKHVVEAGWGGDGIRASYHIDHLKLEWTERTTQGGREVTVPDGMFVYYFENAPDINLPAGVLAQAGGEGILLTATLAVLAGLLHGIRPGPRRRQIGVWAIAGVAGAYGLCALVFVVGIGLQSAGWTAADVGPFILWTGAWAGVVGTTTLAVTIRRVGLVKREPFELPALPSMAD